MTEYESVELTLDGVVSLLQTELAEAEQGRQRGDLDAALDGYVGALGLALQLGPEPTERVLRLILDAGRAFAVQGEADALSALGPALAGLADQVREAGVLPATPTMDAWASVTADLGALLGQVGLALAIPPGHRARMLESARARAALLDDATGDLFGLAPWLDEIASR
jgi:hypothetical protein